MPETLDPISYEIFRHKLFNILEEGRIAIKMVSGSPVVVEGGETMCAFYTADGRTILVAAGILLHCAGAKDFVVKAIEWYEKDPGFYDGDQLCFNDPYIGGQHAADHVILKPIFYKGKRIAWTGSIMHTPETGAIEPGGMPAGATEIYHEGVRFYGLKVVEKGKFRPEVFNSMVLPVRVPHIVGLDIKSKIAANNVCARRFLELVEKFGLDFVESASNKIIADSESMARARLRSLVDGTWRSKLYGDNSGRREKPFKVQCKMTKKGDEVTFDFTGSSPQNEGSINSSYSGAWGSLFAVLCSQLFWEIPWNEGLSGPVKVIFPEASVVNCKSPAACSQAPPTTGHMVIAAAHECIAKMLYASGVYEDVNSGWMAHHIINGYFGGVNQYGENFGGMILDCFAGGCGGTPTRDGVDTGANLFNPTSNISDVEILELSIPILYLARRHQTDSGGFGKHDGGVGPEAVYMVHKTNIMKLGNVGLGRKVNGGFGIFGGYPPALQEIRYVLDSNVADWFKKSKYPTGLNELSQVKGKILDVPVSYAPIPVKQGDLFASRMCAGGGYGDPLERDPNKVREDLIDNIISENIANKIYGVALKPGTYDIDWQTTEKLRAQIKEERLRAKRFGS